MLTHLKLNNFKIWRSTGQMQLAPLTLVFGTNSSGKSSLIQSLLLLRQTVRSQDPNLDLNFGNPDSSDSVVLGQFSDVLCRHGAATEAVKARQIGIEFGWRAGEPGSESGTFTARYVAARGGSADLAYLRIGSGGRGFTAQLGRHGAYKLLPESARYWSKQSPSFKPQRSFSFSDSAVRALGADADRVLSVGPMLLDELARVIYLGPVRRLAQRDYVWNGRTPGSIGDDGGRAVDALIASGVAKQNAEKRGLPAPSAAELFNGTAEWLSRMGLANELQVRQLGRSARYELQVVSEGEAANLKDVGVGVSQVLPVVVAALFAERGSIVMVEEPESHLHPVAQTVLAEMLASVSQDRGVQFIVETHSEHLLRRMQTLVARDTVKTRDLRMYFVEREGTTAKLQQLEVDQFGTIRPWPEYFFGDSAGEAREQAKARAKRMREAENNA
ncbi:energy-coupling factor transporter ATP-binding protein EcfA2 [Paraburkholderia youngii]|uniref:AAA family ATPase n=1 Tax=Paraburkholderia youngii TaxID=2782701 RepID=UPI003D1DC940